MTIPKSKRPAHLKDFEKWRKPWAPSKPEKFYQEREILFSLEDGVSIQQILDKLNECPISDLSQVKIEVKQDYVEPDYYESSGHYKDEYFLTIDGPRQNLDYEKQMEAYKENYKKYKLDLKKFKKDLEEYEELEQKYIQQLRIEKDKRQLERLKEKYEQNNSENS